MATNKAFGDQDHVSDAMPLGRDDLALKELDGEAVLYDARHGAVHRFNATTLRIWHGCSGSQTLEEIAAQLVGDHSIPVDQALKLVNSVIAELHNRDLLHQHSADPYQRYPMTIGMYSVALGSVSTDSYLASMKICEPLTLSKVIPTPTFQLKSVVSSLSTTIVPGPTPPGMHHQNHGSQMGG